MAEYSTVTASAQDAKISYLTNDTLGSPRITTDANGAVISRRDFMPFGEEITTGRTGYGTDAVRQKFTGYEKDAETDLDFAQARYYNKNLGRFTTPDKLGRSAKKSNPQTANRYIYVLNNPLRLIDPSGMMSQQTGDECPHGKVCGTLPDGTKTVEDDKDPINITSKGHRWGWLGRLAGKVEGLFVGKTHAAGAEVDTREEFEEEREAEREAEEWERGVGYEMGMDPREPKFTSEQNKMQREFDRNFLEHLGFNDDDELPNVEDPEPPLNENEIPQLTPAQISNTRIIAKGDGIRDIQRLVNTYGGRASDWTKKSSPVIEAGSRSIEFHWYENFNLHNGETPYREFKAVPIHK